MTTIAIYSHASRKEERERTIREFARVGLPPDVVRVEDGAPSQLANRRNAYQAIREAYWGRPVLLLEDDTTPARTLPAWLKHLKRHERRVTALYAYAHHFYPPDSIPPRASRVATLQNLHAFYGAQAIWFPAARAVEVIAEPGFLQPDRLPADHRMRRSPGDPWDRALREHLLERGHEMGLAVPNVVQHRAPKSIVNRKGSSPPSDTFDENAPAPTP